MGLLVVHTGGDDPIGSNLPGKENSAPLHTITLLRVLYIYFAVAVGLYLVGAFVPDSFLWGMNHLAFVDVWERITVLLFVLLLGLPVFSSRYISFLEQTILDRIPHRSAIRFLAVVLGIVAVLAYYSTPIMTDLYGDTRTLISLLMEKKYSWIDVLWSADREPLTRFMHQFLGDVLQVDYKTVYEVVSAVCGGCFAAVVIYFVYTLNGSRFWKMFLLTLFFTAGANGQFFCHIEDYTVIYLWLTVFFILAWQFFDGQKTLSLMVIVFIIGTRLHVEMVLVLPALVYAILYYNQRKYALIEKLLRPSRVILGVGMSLVFLAALYFLYFHADHYDRGDQQEVLTKIFLPLSGFQTLPFNYSLLSLNHLSDCLQQILLTTSPAAILMIILGFVFGTSIDRRDPRFVFIAIGVFYFLVFNFTFHPMLSMPRDWDLLSLASVPLTFLAIAMSQTLFNRYPSSAIQKNIVGVGFALGMFSFTFFYVNASSDRVGRRLEGVGQWVFKSYHSGSAYILNVSAKMIPDLDEQVKHREQAIRELLPYASTPDYEINFLYHKLGVAQYANRQFEQARISFGESLKRDPANASAIRMLGLIALQRREFDEAARIFLFYNKHVNSPTIVDPGVFEFEEYCNQVKKLVSSNVDSMVIQNKLDDLFRETK